MKKISNIEDYITSKFRGFVNTPYTHPVPKYLSNAQVQGVKKFATWFITLWVQTEYPHAPSS